MKTQQPISDNNLSIKPALELQSFKSAYVILKSCECFISSEEIARTGKIYDLADFLKDGSINFRKVRFLRAYLTYVNGGYTLIFVLLHIKARKIIKRSQRIDNDVCDFVIMDTTVFS
ncbi:MAG: hypothetical protein R6V23_04520 [Bacteroidales bacterium]